MSGHLCKSESFNGGKYRILPEVSEPGVSGFLGLNKTECVKLCEDFSECVSWSYMLTEVHEIERCDLFHTICESSDLNSILNDESTRESDIYECDFVGKIIHF